MSFIVESSGLKNFKIVPVGSHLARCYRLVDLGTQAKEWKGQVNRMRQIMLGWEIHGDGEDGTPLLTDEGKPLALFKNYSFSFGENSNLRKDILSWLGPNQDTSRFDLEKILGQWCMVNVVHREGQNGKTYANVDKVTPVPFALRKAGFPEGVNDIQLFRLAEPDWELYETFSNGLKAKIEMSPEYKAIKSRAAPASKDGFEDMEDDMPF